MIGIKFPSTDKERYSTDVLDIGVKTTFATAKEIIDFFESGYNTFFITNKETFRGKRPKFKQGDNKEAYITQNDLRDEKASVIGLDFDRHPLEDGMATNTDKVQGLIDLSNEFGTVLYAPSKSSTDKIFSGRIFIFLNKPIRKEIFRKYLEFWAFEKYGSGYVVNHHKWNALYFLTGEEIERTHISHEYIDRVAFNPSHKLNVYDNVVFELYHQGKKVWETGSSTIPLIELSPLNIANRLQRFGKADEIQLYNTYNENNALLIRDILHYDVKAKIIEQEVETAKIRLAINKTSTREGATDKEVLQKYRKEFREGEYPADGLLRRASDGVTKTASEWVSDQKTSGNFAYEPNIRKETAYLYIKKGKIFDYQGGQTTLVVLKKRTVFEPILREIEGEYLPDNYYSEVMGQEKISFCQAPTGSGKSHGCSSLVKTIFLVPTRALGEDLGKKDGFMYVRSSGDTNGNIKRINDIPSAQVKDTIVMTYDKFAFIYDSQGLYDYHIIVDEAHLLFSQQFNDFTATREKLMWAMFNKVFKSVMLMSANPDFHKAYEPFVCGEVPRVVVYSKPKKIDFIIKSDFSEKEVERFKQERTIMYCNDKKQAASWAEMIGADVISSENRIMAKIDEHPTKNFVFTAVMREGYSFKSKVDNFIIDTRVNVITGANSVVQAASRARSGATNYYVRHGLGKVENLAYRLGFVSVPLYKELASIFYTEDVYTKEERDVIKHLPLYAPVAKAVSAQSNKLYLSNLVSLALEAVESLERSDVGLMVENLKKIGYGAHIEEVSGEIEKPTKVRDIQDDKERKILKKGKEAYGRFTKISGTFLSGNDLKNKVLGLYNETKTKKRQGIDVKTAIGFLRKVDVTVIPINPAKLDMNKEEFAKATKNFTKSEMLGFMSDHNIKSGRAKVMYWVENIYKLFEKEAARRKEEEHRKMYSNTISYPPPPPLIKKAEVPVGTGSHTLPPPPPTNWT